MTSAHFSMFIAETLFVTAVQENAALKLKLAQMEKTAAVEALAVALEARRRAEDDAARLRDDNLRLRDDLARLRAQRSGQSLQ